MQDIKKAVFTIEHILDVEKYIEDCQAVLFDLDDTLYQEKDYVYSGYQKVAELLPEIGQAYEKMCKAFAEGRQAIDSVLEEADIYTEELKHRCIECYRKQKPDIVMQEEVRNLLLRLRQSGKKLGIITDGRVEGQKNKIAALGLEKMVDEIIITDELAGKSGEVRDFRKPSPIAFQVMQMRMKVPYEKMVYIGDNEAKDFIAPNQLGMKSVYYRNKNGIYFKSENESV